MGGRVLGYYDDVPIKEVLSHISTQQSGKDIHIVILILVVTILDHPYNIHIIDVERISFVFNIKYHMDLQSKIIVGDKTDPYP